MDQSEVLRFEQQQTITKLSEAIRVGAKLRPQTFGRMFYAGKSCALGAAYEVLYGYNRSSENWTRRYSLLEDRFGLDACFCAQQWNDKNRLTREEIADKLESMGY